MGNVGRLGVVLAVADAFRYVMPTDALSRGGGTSSGAGVVGVVGGAE